MLTIRPEYLTLAKLFDGRLFEIPQYQRAYSWTTHEREDLFGDILKTHHDGEDAGHFMAAVVCLRRTTRTLGTDEFHVMEIVDGQQRITTLIILLNTIKLSLDRNSKPEKKLADELAELLVKPEDNEPLLLQTNHDSSQHFLKFMRYGTRNEPKTATTIADRELLLAMEECFGFVRRWRDSGNTLLTLAALLKNRLFFLLHEITDEKTVYTVFEVLNSRGLEVSKIDTLKSILMGEAFELKKANQKGVIKELHTTWRDIYATIGLRQGMSTEALRFAATLRASEAPRRPLGEADAVEALRTQATSAKTIRETASWLLDVTKACDSVMANPRINAVTRISQARLLATAIHLRDDIAAANRDKLLKRWENVTFRIYGMLGNDARTRVGDFVRLAWRVVNENLSLKDIDASITEIGSDFPIKEAVEHLANTNCYEDWEHELRYFLFRYEEHLAEEQDLNFSNEQWAKIWMVSPSDSIEHIWSRNNAPQRQKHRLGNLILLPPKLNSKLQDIAPADKREAYRKTGLLIAGEVADILDSKTWNKDTIDSREKRMLKWAATEWAD